MQIVNIQSRNFALVYFIQREEEAPAFVSHMILFIYFTSNHVMKYFSNCYLNMEKLDHNLEQSWWPTRQPKDKSLPPSSRCFIGMTPDEKLIKVHLAQHICMLPPCWRPIFTLIDLCQLHALSRARDISNNADSISVHLKLLQWFDKIRQYIVIEAKNRKEDPLEDIHWMPDVVHRFCIRVDYGISHQPRKMVLKEEQLQNYYCNPKWSYSKLLPI